MALQTLYKVARRRSVAFVISDFFASGYERALSLASARHHARLSGVGDLAFYPVAGFAPRAVFRGTAFFGGFA